MKIEKINDNQIRFTLNRQDLDEHQVRISELAYGSDKARALFQELMQRASKEVGFEAEDIPLMIEAIPMSGESLVLLVTKVEDPEELDARFSNFTPAKNDTQAPTAAPACADEIINCFEHLENLLSKLGKAAESTDFESDDPETPAEPKAPAISAEEYAEVQSNMARIYAFDNLVSLRKLAAVLAPFYKGSNSLFKDPKSGYYFLILQMSNHTPAEFNKVCNIVTEYGEPSRTTYASTAYFDEHFTPILADTALKQLAKLN